MVFSKVSGSFFVTYFSRLHEAASAVQSKRATTWNAMGSESTLPFYQVLFFIVLIICLWPVTSGWFNCNV